MNPEIQAFLSDSSVPLKIRDNIAMTLDSVKVACGFDLELSSDTLSVLDHYIKSVNQTGDDFKDLVAVTTGSYFGEVLRRAFGGEWYIDSQVTPDLWQVRFHSCPFAVNPVAAAFEIIFRDDSGSSIVVNPLRQEALGQMLDNVHQVSEDEYYSFAGRMDAIHLCIDFLTEIEHLIVGDSGTRQEFGFADPTDVTVLPWNPPSDS